MSNRPEFDLLSDIARLLKKYGYETFESLADRLSSEDFLSALLNILDATAKAGRSTEAGAVPIEKRQRAPKGVREFLIALSDTEPEKSRLLVQFHDSVVARTILPTFREVQFLLSEYGLPAVKVRSRKEAIPALIRNMSALPIEEIRKITMQMPRPAQDDRSLEGWSKIILDKDRRQKGQEEE